jgi:hypothetical protein
MLRARRKRPGDCAAQKRNEFASFHPIEWHPIPASRDRRCEKNASAGPKPPKGAPLDWLKLRDFRCGIP